MVRARRVQGKGDDSTVKLRPVDPGRPLAPTAQDARASSSRSMPCPGAFVCSGALSGRPEERGRVGRAPRRAPDPQAVLQGPACVLRGARPRRHRPRRPVDPGPDLRPEAEVGRRALRPADGCRGVAVPGRLDDLRSSRRRRCPPRPSRSPRKPRAFLAATGIRSTAGQETKTEARAAGVLEATHRRRARRRPTHDGARPRPARRAVDELSLAVEASTLATRAAVEPAWLTADRGRHSTHGRRCRPSRTCCTRRTSTCARPASTRAELVLEAPAVTTAGTLPDDADALIEIDEGVTARCSPIALSRRRTLTDLAAAAREPDRTAGRCSGSPACRRRQVRAS